jgi:hypothetical protein
VAISQVWLALARTRHSRHAYHPTVTNVCIGVPEIKGTEVNEINKISIPRNKIYFAETEDPTN